MKTNALSEPKIEQIVNNLPVLITKHLNDFFYKKYFYKQRQAEIGKTVAI